MFWCNKICKPVALIAALVGAIILICCLPCYIWLILIGIALILFGIYIYKKC